MNCNDCCYNLPKDGHSYCTYEDGECVKISILEKENAELKDDNKVMADNFSKMEQKFYDNLVKAKEIIENIIRVTWGEGWNYSLDWKVKAEQFLKENEKHHYEAEVINGKPTGKAILVPDSLAYAKSIVRDLLNNSDEYAKQRAREFLEENK